MNIVKSLFSWLTGEQFIMYMGGGGGGGSQKSTATSYQTNIPEYAQPYVETMLGATQKQLFQMDDSGNITGFQPYKAYGGTYDAAGNQTSYDPSKGVAGFQPMQLAAQQGIANMQMPGEYGAASNATQQAMQNFQNMGYQAGNFGNQFQAPGAYGTGAFNAANVQGPALQNYQMQGPADVQSQQFGQQAAEQYMSPYMQSVVEKQQREAQRTADVAATGRNAQAVKSGAFGGSRQAIMDAEAERNLAQQKGDIQATGLQSAYQQAQQQFNADQAQRMQAALANQGMGYNVGSQNLAANLGIQQLGAGQNLQAQLANQSAGLNAQQMQEQSRQFGAGQGLNAAQLAAQYGLAGQQLGEQSRQYGAGFGLQANQAAQNAANQLASIGGQRLQAQQGIYGLQNQYGGQQQALQQQILNQAMQDYANAQQYPLMQLGTMSNMLRGLPMQASTTNQYVAMPSYGSQAIGALGTMGSMYNAYPGRAEGGIISVPKYNVGGEVESDLENANDEFLQRQIKESSSPSVKRMAQRILRERQMSKGPGMAGGGIVAFAKGSKEAVVAPADDEETRRAQGILMAAPQPTGMVSENPTTPPDAAPLPQQAVQPTPPPPTTGGIIQAATDLTPAMKALQSDVAKEAGVSTEARLAEIQAAKKAAGIEAPGVEQRARLMEERANAEDEARRVRWLRAAEFFATWGSTPGPTLVAGMTAFKTKVPDLISDEKEAKKARMEIDKSIAALDEATRLEKKGDYEAAAAIKTKWADRMQTLNTEIIKIQEQEAAGVRTDVRQEKRDIKTAEREEKKDIRYADLQKTVTQMKIDADKELKKIEATWRNADKAEANKDRLLGIWRSAQDTKGTVESRISNIMKSDEYQTALANSSSSITSDSSPAAVKMQADAKAALQGFQESFKNMRDTADKTVSLIEGRLAAKGIDTVAPAPTTITKNRPAPKGAGARGATTPPLPPGAKLD